MISASIIADSLNAATGDRLTTMVISFPRLVLAEVNTHRALSKNSASSRAIPVAKMAGRVELDPAMPVEWGRKQSGMQAGAPLDADDAAAAEQLWRRAARLSAKLARRFDGMHVHKQIANRWLEPASWMTTLVSATDWENFFALRCHEAAQPEIQAVADEMLFAYVDGTPAVLQPGEWHIPFGDRMPEGLDFATRLKVATARCARTSYLSFDGNHSTEKDVGLHDDLSGSGHWSPFEHPAQAMETSAYSGNFRGFRQYRKTFAGENRRVDLAALAADRRARRARRQAAA